MSAEEEKDGCFNQLADTIKRKDETWSDGNLTEEGLRRSFELHGEVRDFARLVCRNCGNKTFEVLITGPYETTAKCVICGMYYVVHEG